MPEAHGEPSASASGQLRQIDVRQQTIRIRQIHPSQLNIKVLAMPQNEADIEMDIVAVHGLGADPDSTWEHTESTGAGRTTVNWLKDPNMLPKALPKARIMRFGYNSSWFGPGAIDVRVGSIAKSLLQDLRDARKKHHHRPLIFIGHCFGGIVMQKAYVQAKVNDSDYPGIFQSTIGMIFMGTPHHGTTNTALHSQGAIYNVIAAARLEAQTGVLAIFETGNELLDDLVETFTRQVGLSLRSESGNGPGTDLFCFYEESATAVGRIVGRPDVKEFVVGKAWGTLHGFESRGLPLDHFNLNKFQGDSETDGNYDVVRREIVRMAERGTMNAVVEVVTSRQIPAPEPPASEQPAPEPPAPEPPPQALPTAKRGMRGTLTRLFRRHSPQGTAQDQSARQGSSSGSRPSLNRSRLPEAAPIPRQPSMTNQVPQPTTPLSRPTADRRAPGRKPRKMPLKLATKRIDLDLIKAAQSTTGTLEGFQALIEEGGDPRCTDADRRGPLFWAALKGNLEVVEWLFENLKALDRDNPGQGILEEIDMCDEQEATPLLCAANGGHERVVEYLLSTGRVDKNARDWQGKTPMSVARKKGHNDVITLLSR